MHEQNKQEDDVESLELAFSDGGPVQILDEYGQTSDSEQLQQAEKSDCLLHNLVTLNKLA